MRTLHFPDGSSVNDWNNSIWFGIVYSHNRTEDKSWTAHEWGWSYKTRRPYRHEDGMWCYVNFGNWQWG